MAEKSLNRSFRPTWAAFAPRPSAARTRVSDDSRQLQQDVTTDNGPNHSFVRSFDEVPWEMRNYRGKKAKKSRKTRVMNSVTRKKLPNVYKTAQKWCHWKNDRFIHLYKKCLRMWEIWANYLLPKALKRCPKCKKSPNLVTLVMNSFCRWFGKC